jgi:hypothetical protein
MEMDYVLQEHVFARKDSMDLIVLSQTVPMTVIHMECVRTRHAIVMKDLQVTTAIIEHVRMNVVIRANALKMGHVNAIKGILE